METEYLKETLFDLFETYNEYEDIKNCLGSLYSLGEISKEEYDLIIDNYDEWLNEWLENKDKKQRVIDDAEHNEELLSNCISYLWEIWKTEDTDTILKSFKHLGFNDTDLKYWNISNEIETIKNEE